MYQHALRMEQAGLDREAGHWMQKAAYHGHLEAQVEVGFMYVVGRTGFLRDSYELERWFRTEVVRGRPTNRFALGYAYELGTGGVLINADDARHWFEKAVRSAEEGVRQGDPAAMTTLGLLVASGRGTARNLARARALWNAAAEQGYGPAHDHLARLHWYHRRYEAARTHLVAAARAGSASAQFKLARLYQGGFGIDSNPERVMVLLRQASEAGHLRAQRQLRAIRHEVSGAVPSPQSG